MSRRKGTHQSGALLWRALALYLILAGLLAHLAVGGALLWAHGRLGLTPVEVARAVLQRADAPLPGWLHPPAAPPPAPRFADHALDGRVKASRPRILMPALAGWDGRGVPGPMRERAARYRERGLDAPDPCATRGLLALTVCWLVRHDDDAGARALEALRTFQPTPPSVTRGEPGSAWVLALAFDLLSLHPALAESDRRAVESTLERALVEHLALLDEDGASLWHGRATLAAHAWTCAVALGGETPERRRLLTRAQGHFLDVMRALALTEAWPEGYSYWINSRAFPLALAAAAYLHGLEDARERAAVRRILERTGLWHVYATRPDGRIEGFGDEGPRVDLEDDTRRAVDLLAHLTGSSVLATYSRWLGERHGAASYWKGHRWAFWLVNDPAIEPLPGIEEGTLAGLARWLPGAEIFGRGALNLAYARSGWGAEDTFVSFRAGHSFTHHGHYDAGHFTLFKGAPLAANASTYGDYYGPNRLNWAIRTVAKNSLLVLRPGERVRPNRLFRENVADGGQRLVLPTGSAITSVADWLDDLDDGRHLEGAELLAFDHVEEDYTYLAADLTGAYNSTRHDDNDAGGKVGRVARELLYLRGSDRLVVRDVVEATDPAYTKKWLLHTPSRPAVDGLRVLAGEASAGILESAAATARVASGRGHLLVERVLPADAVLRLVGGPGWRYYVESDGDDSDLDGANQDRGASPAPWFDHPEWRIEIQPRRARARDRFLVVLSPSLEVPRASGLSPVSADHDGVDALVVDDTLLVFLDAWVRPPVTLRLAGSARRVLVLGALAGTAVTLRGEGLEVAARANEQRVATAGRAAALPATVTIGW